MKTPNELHVASQTVDQSYRPEPALIEFLEQSRNNQTEREIRPSRLPLSFTIGNVSTQPEKIQNSIKQSNTLHLVTPAGEPK